MTRHSALHRMVQNEIRLISIYYIHGVFDGRITAVVRGLKTEARCCSCTRCASTRALALAADSFAVAGVAADGLESEGSLLSTADCATLDACYKSSVGRIINKHSGSTKKRSGVRRVQKPSAAPVKLRISRHRGRRPRKRRCLNQKEN